MATSNNNSGGGIGFAGALTLIFITLKLLAVEPVAAWSWVWVLSPMWIGLAVMLGVVAVIFTVYALLEWNETRKALRSFRDDLGDPAEVLEDL